MKITLLKGSFDAMDLQNVLTEMIHVKIRYHESKIEQSDGEETIKMREKRVIELQKDLYELRKYIQKSNGLVSAEAEINIE